MHILLINRTCQSICSSALIPQNVEGALHAVRVRVRVLLQCPEEVWESESRRSDEVLLV